MLHKTESRTAQLNPREMTNLGIEEMAYIKTITNADGEKMHSIHAADGTPLTVVVDRKIAFATVSQHDMQPMSVH